MGVGVQGGMGYNGGRSTRGMGYNGGRSTRGYGVQWG